MRRHRCLALTALFTIVAGCGGTGPPHSREGGPGAVEVAKAKDRAAGDPKLGSLGTIEVTARLVELPEGAIFERDLYHYAAILKYEVVEVQRGPVEKGATIYVGHYDPWKPRGEAADKQVKDVGGTLARFAAGQLHRMALTPSMDDDYMGAIVDKYFGKRTGPTYWALWTNPAD